MIAHHHGHHVRVPDERGRLVQKAERQLHRHHLKVGEITYTVHSDLQAGAVVREAHANRQVKRHARINLVVSESLTQEAEATATQAQTTMVTVAHEDDPTMFMNPDLENVIRSGKSVDVVFVTAGDDGRGPTYWQSREAGAEASFANMAGVSDTWGAHTISAGGHTLAADTLLDNPHVTLVFMRLPNQPAANSTTSTQLEALYTGQVSSLTTVDATQSYTRSSLTNTLLSLMQLWQPQRIDTQDFSDPYDSDPIGSAAGMDDHPDHRSVGFFTRDAFASYRQGELVGYYDYPIANMKQNVFSTAFARKLAAWHAYAPLDFAVPQNDEMLFHDQWGGLYGRWIGREYVRQIIGG